MTYGATKVHGKLLDGVLVEVGATEINFEKLPAGGGARGLIRNSPKLARLRFHCRFINRGKGGEVVKVYTITYFKM